MRASGQMLKRVQISLGHVPRSEMAHHLERSVRAVSPDLHLSIDISGKIKKKLIPACQNCCHLLSHLLIFLDSLYRMSMTAP